MEVRSKQEQHFKVIFLNPIFASSIFSNPAIRSSMSWTVNSARKNVIFRLCLFWVKITSGNEAVWLVRKILFSWKWNPLTQKNAFDHGNRFTLLFSLQSISGKWERERERVRARGEGRTRSRHREIAPLIVISPSRDRVGERSERKNLNCAWVFFGLWLVFF